MSNAPYPPASLATSCVCPCNRNRRAVAGIVDATCRHNCFIAAFAKWDGQTSPSPARGKPSVWWPCRPSQHAPTGDDARTRCVLVTAFSTFCSRHTSQGGVYTTGTATLSDCSLISNSAYVRGLCVSTYRPPPVLIEHARSTSLRRASPRLLRSLLHVFASAIGIATFSPGLSTQLAVKTAIANKLAITKENHRHRRCNHG